MQANLPTTVGPDDGLFDCTNHIPSCIWAMCCPFVMLGQLYEKIVGPRGQCIKITIILFVVAMMQSAVRGPDIMDGDGNILQPGDNGTSNLLSMLQTFLMVYFTWVVYATYRMYYTANTESSLQSFVKVFCCTCCLLSQMARKVYNYPVTEKKGCCVFGPTGDEPYAPAYLWDTADGTTIVGSNVVVQPYGTVVQAVPVQPASDPDARRMSTLV
mmetsp:Transcript_32487/g.85546  ORF Transcript_32487/g.85546 Transcript_32487/m.85546 type:complete len:214 (-) Transcript_32487:186-827(-)